jgi:hypothetical protein
MNYLQRDTPRHLRGRERDLFQLQEQQKWVEACERNGVSYSGPNGPAIRRADMNVLRNLEERVRQ